VAGAIATCLLTCVAQAASCGKSAAGFEQWKVEFAETAKAAGVKSIKIHSHLRARDCASVCWGYDVDHRWRCITARRCCYCICLT